MLNRGPKMSIKRVKVLVSLCKEGKPDLNFMLTTQTKTSSRQWTPAPLGSTISWHMDCRTPDSRAEDAGLPRHVLKWFSNELLDAFILNYINTLTSMYCVQNLLTIHYVLQINPVKIKESAHTKEQSTSVALAGLESRAICQRKTLIPRSAVIVSTGYLEYNVAPDIANT